eukprot:COSAG02_NODE_31956_length_524_cov_1.315294_1_plen_93_part_01
MPCACLFLPLTKQRRRQIWIAFSTTHPRLDGNMDRASSLHLCILAACACRCHHIYAYPSPNYGDHRDNLEVGERAGAQLFSLHVDAAAIVKRA